MPQQDHQADLAMQEAVLLGLKLPRAAPEEGRQEAAEAKEDSLQLVLLELELLLM
jgi:hypothetical protein